jgi:hypothetical protein
MVSQDLEFHRRTIHWIVQGGWRAQIDDALRPNAGPFFGKVDIYHALGAYLIPTLPTTGNATRGLLETNSTH